MPRFKVIKPIVHDGKPYEPGKTLEVSAETARHALAKGYVVPVKDGRRKPS